MKQTGRLALHREEARKLVKALYEATEGKAQQWRTIIGLSAKQSAVDYAVEKGWILVEGGHSVCLTEQGTALIRR
jgi:hypothetical protein